MNFSLLTQIETIIGISNGSIQVTTKNVYYWITHYIFDDVDGITENLVKARVKQLVKEHGIEITKEKQKRKKKKVEIEKEDESSSTEEQIIQPLKPKKRIVRRPGGHF